ncbi:zinc finger, CCHC-type containing protein [Tanacetum coccineum]|uniref:Zinc finger, CCHC-type containing protein n=1 Tax=Tanacetum coccineum TaxID=301880 RepID=A0ABQ4XBF0_9ASTR
MVQNGCLFYGLQSEDPNQHLKDFIKLVDSLDLNGDNRERTRLCLFQFSLCDQARTWLERLLAGSITTWEDLTTHFLTQFFLPGRTAKLRNDILMFQQHQGESLSEAWTRFKDLLQKVPHHVIDLWLQFQIFYDRINKALKESIDYAAEGRLRKLSIENAWATIEKLAHYEDEGWNDPVILEEGNLNYENPDIEQLLGEERVRQLEEYMKVIVGDFMQLYSEVIRRLKGKLREEASRTMSKGARSTRGQSLPPKKYHWRKRFEGSGQGLDQAFFKSINKDPFSEPQWVNLFQINENVYLELVHEFFALFEFDASPCRYDPNHLGVRESATLSGLRKGVTVKANYLLLGFWPTIGDGGFNIRNTKVTAIRDPKVKLAHRCIATTIVGTKESTHKITEIDLFYLYCIYFEGVICNIPYWLAKLLTNEMISALSVDPSPLVLKKKSLFSMGVVMELHNGACFWPATQEVKEEDDEADEAAGGDAGNKGVGGSADMYRNMSQGDWQVPQARWIDQQEKH